MQSKSCFSFIIKIFIIFIIRNLLSLDSAKMLMNSFHGLGNLKNCSSSDEPLAYKPYLIKNQNNVPNKWQVN